MALLEGAKGEPEPAGGSGLADARVQLIHLDDSENEVAEQMVVPALAVAAHPLEPASNRGIRVTGETDQHGSIDTFGQKPEHELDFFGAGFQIVERRVDTAGKDLATGLALETLNAVGCARVNRAIGHAAVVTSGVRAGETAGRDSFLESAAALAFRIGQQVAFGAHELETETGLAVRTIVRRLRFPAARMVFAPACPPLVEVALQSAALPQQQNHQQ